VAWQRCGPCRSIPRHRSLPQRPVPGLLLEESWLRPRCRAWRRSYDRMNSLRSFYFGKFYNAFTQSPTGECDIGLHPIPVPSAAGCGRECLHSRTRPLTRQRSPVVRFLPFTAGRGCQGDCSQGLVARSVLVLHNHCPSLRSSQPLTYLDLEGCLVSVPFVWQGSRRVPMQGRAHGLVIGKPLVWVLVRVVREDDVFDPNGGVATIPPGIAWHRRHERKHPSTSIRYITLREFRAV